MKTFCPLQIISGALWAAVGDNGGVKCMGPNCQLWPKCRQDHQCPKCGAEGHKVGTHIYECKEHGLYDFSGDFLPNGASLC
jgi:ribosomal protein L37AE/L43A